jgi:hypothetical protein
MNGYRKPKDHLEDIGIDGKIILEWILEKVWKGVDWMHLNQDRDQCLAVVNRVMNIRIT